MSLNISTRLRHLAYSLGLAAVVLPGLVSQADAESPRCRLDVFSLRALDLQESSGDEIFLRLNGIPHPRSEEVHYTQIGQIEQAAAFSPPTPAVFYGDETDPATVKVIEDDAIFNQKIGGTLTEICRSGEAIARRHIFQDSTAAYQLDYAVTVVFDPT